MPLSYTFDPDRMLMLITGSGELSTEDIRVARQALAAEPRMQKGIRVLADMRALIGFELAGREVFALARSREDLPFISPENRVAIVVRDAAGFALARMYILSRRGEAEPMAAFYSMDEAAAWLDLEPPDAGAT